MHNYRVKVTGTTEKWPDRRLGRGKGWIDPKGYRKVSVDGRTRQEHRVVMERTLGRPLRPYETVHHRNGVRHDNRLENLELWCRPPLSGQRVDDLVAFVAEAYPREVRRALDETA